jgi:hypothetical protein
VAERLQAGDNGLRTSLSLAQQRFYEACRFAAQGLATLDPDGDTGPNGLALEAWLSGLREQNRQLAQQYGFESLRAEAERQAQVGQKPETRNPKSEIAPGRISDFGFLPRRGSPMFWQGAAGVSPPRLVLTTRQAGAVRRATGVSIAWLLLLATAGLAAQFPGVRAWLRLFWPEQVVLLGCIVWQVFGPNLLLFFLIALGISGRVVSLGQWLVRWVRRSEPVPPSTPTA